MATHAMIDIETLGTEPDCVVLSVGAVKFDPYKLTDPHAKTLWRPSADEQMTADRSVLESTLQWWAGQPQQFKTKHSQRKVGYHLKCFLKISINI